MQGRLMAALTQSRGLLLISLLSTLISSCGLFTAQHYQNADVMPPQPVLDELPCCWQSEEQLLLKRGNKELALRSIIARQKDQLAIVVLDSLGHRQLTLNYKNGTIETLSAPPNWDDSYSHYMMYAIFLHHREPGPWSEADADWQIIAEPSGQLPNRPKRKILRYKGANKITLNYNYAPHGENADIKHTRTVQIGSQEPFLTVRTLSKISL